MLLLGNSFSPARCATMVPALHCAGEAPICAHRYTCTTKCYERIYVFFIWASFKHSLQNFISEPTCWFWSGLCTFWLFNSTGICYLYAHMNHLRPSRHLLFKKQLNIVWYVFEFKCALSFDHDLCWFWTFPYQLLWLVHHR